MAKRFPKSIRKFLRLQKAKIRRKSFDTSVEEEEIKKLYQKIGRAQRK